MVDNFIDANPVVVDRELFDEVGGFDESLRRTVDWDLLIRLARKTEPVALPFIGVRYDDNREGVDRITTTGSSAWRERILSKHLIDWDAEAARPREADRVSTVMPTYEDWNLTRGGVRAVVSVSGAADVEVVVLDNGSRPAVCQVLRVHV